MRRLIYYELKAMFRYSSGAKRRWLSLVAYFIIPAYFIGIFYLRYRVAPDTLRNIIDRYALFRRTFIGAALLGGSIIANIGRVSTPARELIFSSPVSNWELFRALFVVASLNSLVIIRPIGVVLLFYGYYIGFALYLSATFFGTLIGYAYVSPATGYKEFAVRIAPIALVALLSYFYLDAFRPFNDIFFERRSMTGLVAYGIVLVLTIAAVSYGIKNAHSIVIRSEAIVRRGSYRGGSTVRLAMLHAIRYPALIAIYVLLPGLLVFDLLFVPMDLENIFMALSSTGFAIPMLVATISLYALSRELGRRDLRLSSPNDGYVFEVRHTFMKILLYLTITIAAAFVAIRSEIIYAVYVAIRLYGLYFLSYSVALYYIVGSVRPVSGSLSDAFRAPLAKQVFVGIILSIAAYLPALMLLIAAYYRSEYISILISVIYAGASMPIFNAARKRFLNKARKL